MRIGIDLQGLQSEGSRIRGIGRYSFEIVRHLIKVSPNHDFILIANGSLKNLEFQFKSELKLDNVSYIEWSSPCPFDYISSNHNLSELACYVKSYTCACLYLDIVIITSFVEGFSDNCLIEFDRELVNFKILSIFYDLIPILNPKFYFNGNLEFEKFYLSKLKQLKQVDGLLAISESSAQEAHDHLDFNRSFVFNISSACDKKIFNISRKIVYSDAIKPLLDEPFLLYAGAGDSRKNLKGLLEAYSLLPQNLKHFKLVFAGKLIKPEQELISKWLTSYGIDSNNVIQTGYISDNDLVGLYRNCNLFIFPSFHEGFGLPVLEAMSCGAPVIGSNTTSIPEVIGKSEAMFDPDDPENINQLIQKVLYNPQFREELVINSKEQSEKFSWIKTASAAKLACEKIVGIDDKKTPNSSYQSIIKQNKNNLENLFLKISKINFLNKNPNDQIWLLIASSIDRINKQIDFLIRGFSNPITIGTWRVEGPFDSSYSLAKLNRHFVESLNTKLLNPLISVTEGFGDYPINLDYLRRFSLIHSIFLKSKNKSPEIDVLSRNLYPPRVKDLNSRINILHSYGWEESKFPYEWVDDFNTYLQGITVMSRQVKKILIDSGVKIPVRVSGLGLDHIDRIDPDFSFELQSKKFKILHISSCFPRKGIDILLNAFCETFTNQDDVSLIIKTFNNPHNDIENKLQKIKVSNSHTPEIIVINDDMTDEQIKGLIIQSDVLVAPSRGEGFGFPIGEAMRLGIPVITTGWGGQLDFCTNENSWLIDYKFAFSKSHFNINQSYWAEPSQKHLSELLYQIYSSDKKLLTIKTDRAKKDTNFFTWDSVAENNINFVQKDCIRYKSNYFKLGLLSTWNSKCGIASYSKNMFYNINEELVIFTPYEEENSNIGSNKVVSAWHLDNENQNFQNLYKYIISEEITTLFIQFNYGWFCFKNLSNLIDFLEEKNINVVILLHSTIDPKNDITKRLFNLKNCLLKCNRVFVHTIDDLNRLKDLGIIHNSNLLCHGISDLIPNNNLRKSVINKFKFTRQRRIASYGFCLPNKGFKELIYAVSLLQESGMEISLTIFSAIYSDEYEYYFHELQELIQDLNLNNFVSIIGDYMSDEDTINQLSTFDCIVFPYQKSNESSSAAVRQGLASLRPILVTPLDIFNDVADLVEYLPGKNSKQISEGIDHWFKSEKPRLLQMDYFHRKKLLSERRFTHIREYLINTLKSLELDSTFRNLF